MARAIVTVPATAKRGEVIQIRAVIQHPMETGYRPGSDGRVLPRDLVRRFVCRYDDGSKSETVFSAELFAAVAANPSITFHTVATASGKLTFTWEGDNGFAHTETAELKVV